ncbi:hypothetical protein [Methyloferula stellata]|uniref:hypothetical protein n=1 Tax=Methyloferula stellata TaxID=876270 RepID=UPI00037E1EED|nr:hypothetical protein [Methyloferula stellata]
MNFKQAVFIGLMMASLASDTLIELAAAAEYLEFPFGGGFWSGQSSYAPPAEAYPALKPYVPRRAAAKPRHPVVHKAPLDRAIQDADAPPHASPLAEELAAMQKQNPGALAIFLRDDTLRKSDAVVTNTGILVFKGKSQDHSAKDFVSLPAAKGVPHRTELAAIQKVFVQHFEVVRVAKLTSAPGFGEKQAAPKPFESVEIKAIRRIAGVPAFQ